MNYRNAERMADAIREKSLMEGVETRGPRGLMSPPVMAEQNTRQQQRARTRDASKAAQRVERLAGRGRCADQDEMDRHSRLLGFGRRGAIA